MAVPAMDAAPPMAVPAVAAAPLMAVPAVDAAAPAFSASVGSPVDCGALEPVLPPSPPKRPPPQLVDLATRAFSSSLHCSQIVPDCTESTASQALSLAFAPAWDPTTAPPIAPAKLPTIPKAPPSTAEPA